MSEHEKHHLTDAIKSAVRSTLHHAAAATDPDQHEDEYWYNLATGEVEHGQQSPITSLWGPFKTYEEAAHAIERAHERNEQWENTEWTHAPGKKQD